MTITADFSGGEKTVTTEPLYQWDTGQKLALLGLPATSTDIQVHFANAAMAQAIVKATELVDSLPTCDIPNEFLQFGSAAKARAWVFYKTSNTEGYTVRAALIPITPRKRPNDYVSPTDPDSKGIVEQAIELLESYETDITGKEDVSNKKTTLTGNESSNDFYPTTKAVADALNTKAPASEVGDLKSAIENLEAIPTEVKRAMDTLFSKAAYADDDAASSYATFHAWAISNPVTFITAVFTQGSATIHDMDSLDTLKQYLTVTATYSDSTTATVTDYTLSGTLTKGTSTITVSYGGKTTTFSVTVTETARILVESGKKASYTTGLLETTDEEVSVTSIIPVSDSTVSHAVEVKVNGSIVNTLIRAYDQNGMFYASTGGWETLQSVPSAINFAGFRILLQCVVSSTDEIVAIIDNEEYPVYIGVVEDYSNTVNVLAKITDYSAAEGESEGSNYVLTDFIPINPTSGTDQTAVYNFVTDPNLKIMAYQLTDNSDTPISTRIGDFTTNTASGKPKSGVTRFRIIFAKRDQSDFTSAELANISLVNNDMVIFALTERR